MDKEITVNWLSKKQKLRQLQQEFESKALQVLTEEQRTQFERFQKRRPEKQRKPEE